MSKDSTEDLKNMYIVGSHLEDIAMFIHHNAKLKSYNPKDNGSSTFLYKIGTSYITVKRDANYDTYTIQLHLKKHSTIIGELRSLDSEVIASSPGDEIPF